MTYLCCGPDSQSADNAFLCEYYGVLPALVELDSPSPPQLVKTAEESAVDRNSLFSLALSREIPQLYETMGVPPQPAGTARVVIVSDTHERHREMHIPPGDILLHAGDILEGFNIVRKTKKVLRDFFSWINEQPHAVKIIITGNHDRELAKLTKETIREMAAPALYLQDEAARVEPIGLRVFGSPRSEANSRLSPNGAYQGKSWWKPMPAPANSTAQPTREGSQEAAASDAGLPPPLALTVHLEGPQPEGPIDILLTHQSAEFGSPAEVAAQAITKFAMDVAPRRLHCAGHLHASHGLHTLPVPKDVSQRYGLRAEALPGKEGVEHDCVTVTKIPFLPSLNAAMLIRSRGRDVLQRPCVVDIQL